MEDNKTEDLWNPYKELLKVINRYVCDGASSLPSSEFENVLRRHKQNFLSLLQNPPKSPKSREELKKGMVEGITVRGIGHQILSKELYQEAIILSDMYDLNEFVALDLLCTAQIQMTYYPGLPRGLVAILLYYDGRKCLVSALRILVQARKGIQWTVSMKPDVQTFITNYTDQLLESGLFDRIFELIRTLDWSKELEKLQHNLALGGPKHRRMVVDLFNTIRHILADIVFIWAAQTGLPTNVMSKLIGLLQEQKNEDDASGKIDSVTFLLQMGFLAAIDLSALHIRENGEQFVRSLPVLSDKSFLEMMITDLTPSKRTWACQGLQALSMYGFSVTLALLRLLPQCQDYHFAIEYENNFIDAAMDLKVFEFLNYIFLENDLLYEEEFLLKRMHNLITDFIVLMYSKVKEMRIKADETARTVQVYFNEGLEAPVNLPRHFEHLLLSISKLYSKDPLKLELMIDYWCPLEINPNLSYSYRAPPRSVSLFKFLRLAGDMVPANLFVPYLKMLKSLSNCQQAARHCFNMLKQSGQGYNNTISWDHFFISFNQYYGSLKQEAPPINDTVYRSRMYHKGITPQEVQGLHAVLELIRTVAEKDEFSRLALCEHPGWAPLTILLGLVACSVPLSLKANLLYALAALCKSHDIASQMWNNLEDSQILVTIPSTSSYQPRGIQTELEEVEARNEEYPLTRAFLEFLDILVDSGIPRTLGAGPRKPGFDPYLTFIINSVFLKFHNRAYKDESEKWMVAAVCLKLLEKFLKHYEPQHSDFPNTTKQNEFNSPPGFHIMLQMNSKTEFLNLILFIIDEGSLLLEQYTPFPGKEFLAKAILSCLNIIERSLVLQHQFVNMVLSSSCPVLLSHLNKLLLTINPRTGKPDYCNTFVKYINLVGSFPNHTLASAKILLNLTSSPLVHSHLTNIFLSTENHEFIRDAFVECLDASCESKEDEPICNSKEYVLKILKQCLPYSSPNLTHFLLGFDLKRDISQTLFQLPGVLDFPRTCIHSLFSILHSAISNDFTIALKPTLLESAYHLLYLLCSNYKTYNPVLRFLRLNQKFFKQHLIICAERANDGLTQLNQLSWLLKTLAVEIKLTCCSKQVFYLKELLNLLLGISEDDDLFHDSYSIVQKSSHRIDEISSMASKNEKRTLLIDLLMKFDFKIQEIISPKWECFDNNVLETLLNSCRTETAPKLIDLKKLHRVLVDEVAAIQGSTAVGQKHAIFQEIQKILVHALNLNNLRTTAAGMIEFVDGWRQVLEVICIYLPSDILSISQQQVLCITFLEKMLNKVVNEELLVEVAIHLSGAILLLLEHLRRCNVREKRYKELNKKNEDLIFQHDVLKSNIVSLQNILERLLEWITNSDVTSQKLRINLYGCLVTFLHLINIKEEQSDVKVENSTFVSRLDSSKVSIKDQEIRTTIPINLFSIFGEKLIDLICQDCTGGHDVCKMLSMASFSILINLTGNINWIMYMSARGYIKHIIESILNSDDDLRAVLEPVPQNLRPLYLYESKMSLLNRIATTHMGSELLLEQRLMSCLCNMKVFDYHPELVLQADVPKDTIEDFILPVEIRYFQLLFPALNICNAILTSLGTINKSAASQIISFLLSHVEIVELVLRGGTPVLTLEFLKELAYLTSVIARTATNELLLILEEDKTVQDSRVHLHKIKKLMLGLIPKFMMSERTVKELSTSSESDHTHKISERLLYAQQVTSNLLLYSRNIIGSHGIEHSSVDVVFAPSITTSLSVFGAKQDFANYTDQSPNLGVVIQILLNSVNYYHQEKVTVDNLSRRLREIPEMNSVDLKEFHDQSETFNINIIRETAYDAISKKLQKKKKEIECCLFTIENSLYLIWTHLEFYMLKAIPKSKFVSLVDTEKNFAMDTTLSSAADATWKCSLEDISSLKHNLYSVLNDSFCRQLLDTAQESSELDKSFLEVLLRKIKRLIQFVPVK
ncbi:nuclear pore complex protein Nup205 [Agrilus planipennis]|uniref:Nuclear pore complex protein Nup205 n=1 Tax=Agrilus planipennis TaxID=224129 RepID=A0A1W4WWK3_AGRPL|nr:nuclear pore complex protein Nup205 [Agrilus planipennis]